MKTLPATPSPPEDPLVAADAWHALKAHTPARIALGRAGASLPTAELLRFGAAHAQARDAVHVPLDTKALASQLRDAGFATLQVESAAPDRATYLMRPDLGRRLSERSLASLQATDVAPCDLLLVVGDGLSSLAVSRHALPLVQCIAATAPAEWTLGPVVVATQARVALGDDIGAALHASMVAILIGERPGLSSPDSLGLYLSKAPRPGLSDAQRNCISNIRLEGLSHADAARKLWWLCGEARRLGCTGVGLKDLSDAAPLVPPHPKGLQGGP
jgi:ethanolamine ammonia-lyase small subunit